MHIRGRFYVHESKSRGWLHMRMSTVHTLFFSPWQIHASNMFKQFHGKKVENHGNPGLCLLWPLLCVRGIQWLLAQKGGRHVPDIWTEGNTKTAFWCFLGFHVFYVLLTSRSTTTLANSTAWMGKQPVTKYTYLLWIPQIPNIVIYTDIYIYIYTYIVSKNDKVVLQMRKTCAI